MQVSKLQAMREAVAVGLASGPGIPEGEVFDRLEANISLQRLKDAHAARRKSGATASSSAASAPDPSIVQKVFDQGAGDTIKFNF